MIANKIKNLYPSAVINEDYKIEFENLNTNDIVQGKELKIKIKPTKNSKVKEELNFRTKKSSNWYFKKSNTHRILKW